jgi:hypothetical protein
VLGQIEIATGNPRTRELIDAHTRFATYGENLGAPDCGLSASTRTCGRGRRP